ncbi:hypothetical protein WJX75_003509 [Coccomyxa subellipsoidea]|uniref:Uncharacterized protein n=1 Tax=Coccomyxa subellipsoidea TaxID=248742 RepID=A0ABR2YTE7_9CHLO
MPVPTALSEPTATATGTCCFNNARQRRRSDPCNGISVSQSIWSPVNNTDRLLPEACERSWASHLSPASGWMVGRGRWRQIQQRDELRATDLSASDHRTASGL